jgi:hypothetical protein
MATNMLRTDQLEYLLANLETHYKQLIASYRIEWRSAEDREAALQALVGSVSEARSAAQNLEGTRDPVLTGLIGKLIVQTELADGTLKDPSMLRR